MRWMYNCQEASEIISESMDRDLPFSQRVLIRMHLLMCKYCRMGKEQFKIIRAASRYEELYGRELDASRSLSREGKERLKEFLKNNLTDVR